MTLLSSETSELESVNMYFQNVPFSGLAFYTSVVKMKATKRLEGVDNCAASQDDFESLLAVHRDFEQW